MKIKIELLSDLCSYSGETYNTIVDSDVVHDEYGLPYIPAKRIKGCIREAALELRDLGLIDHYDEIFGDKGNKESCFTLSNAYLENRNGLVKAINNFKKKSVVEPTKILEEFTYTRTQTRVDYKTGVALDNSLRTIRVVRKGLVFYASLNFRNSAYLEEFKKAVSIVKHIGVSRTRGLGLVRLSVIENNEDKVNHVQFNEVYDKNVISYTIHLKSKMICKSPLGNQGRSEDYIAGSKVLGLIASSLGKDGYSEIANKIVVSNAYITSDNKRCLPGKVSLQKVKDQKYVDGKMEVVDMLYFTSKNDDKQRSPLNAAYMSKDNVVRSVDKEITYHHQRPDDKSIGRATGSDGAFYQLGSISEGQTFKGFIYCDKDVALKIKDSLSKLGEVRMGYGRNSEFGSVDFTLDSNLKVNDTKETVHDCDLLLVSDAILYNKQGMLVADIKALEEYLRQYYGVDDIEISLPFLKYSTIGGFNVTWGRRKQTFNALGKGSVVRVHSNKGFNEAYGVSNFIGERVSEGYGEFVLDRIKDTDLVTVYKKDDVSNDDDSIEDKKIINNLLVRECKKNIDESIRDIVATIKMKDEDLNPALSKIRLAYRDKNTYEEMHKELSDLESSNKDKCLKLMKLVTLDIVDDAIRKTKGLDQNFKWDASDSEKFKYLYYVYISELKNKMKIDTKESNND